ncbi:hypothetical protein KQ874_00595 [Mycoplasma sp. ES3157-GEN-MYC]|uniref:Uncharacterized protein n=1 Tax=Mycoplasma miroungigenitalium TaxID=754515 RepID=A0A6M4JAM6_9MOLU|nr:hypothetical protein [Mycoplasma miroungigenitalium]MBU4690204.1 hypothetical protein [Mycoplasma miroungigenitalium]QJR43308.1 hypothetical protein HLA87_00590 [Mycoplasma miroungigenitalium]
MIPTQTIDQPLDEYKSYENKHKENVENFFKELTEKSNIDVNANRSTSDKIYKKDELINKWKNKLSKLRVGTAFNILFIVLACSLPVWTIIYLVHKGTENIEISTQTILISTALFVLSILAIVGLSVIQALVINKRIKSAEKIKNKFETEREELVDEAYRQLNPLLNIIRPGYKIKIFKNTMPILEMDRHLNIGRLRSLAQNYDFKGDTNHNQMHERIQSGTIYGNPFIISSRLLHEMGTKTYTGTLFITWTEYSYDSNGKRVAVACSETLVARVVKPFPEYWHKTYIYIGSQAAPDLYFTRNSNNINNESDSQIDKYVKKYDKILKKMMKDNPQFTALANTEFEACFGATDRNHEQQFRLLFTPLAQQNIVKLLTDKKYGYGDDMFYGKYGKLNLFQFDHLTGEVLDENVSIFRMFDYDKIKELFYKVNHEYFKTLYFAFAPYFSIPIFQQTKAIEYIYNDKKEYDLNEYEYEHQISYLPRMVFDHHDTQTQSILKTSFISNNGEDTEQVRVKSSSFKIKQRVDYVSVRGGDGHHHMVPVPWDEYIPISKETDILIKKIQNYPIDIDDYKKEISDSLSSGSMGIDTNIDDKDLFLSYGSIIKILN